jgi:hypothetical protein
MKKRRRNTTRKKKRKRRVPNHQNLKANSTLSIPESHPLLLNLSHRSIPIINRTRSLLCPRRLYQPLSLSSRRVTTLGPLRRVSLKPRRRRLKLSSTRNGWRRHSHRSRSKRRKSPRTVNVLIKSTCGKLNEGRGDVK